MHQRLTKNDNLAEMINWTWTKTDGDCGWAEWSFWMVFSIFFPISVVIYQVVVVCRGRAYYKERHARIKVLNSISTMTKVRYIQILLIFCS